jgi:hypothetical protein
LKRNCQSGVRSNEFFHFGGIDRDDDGEPVALVFHQLEECGDRFLAEYVVPPPLLSGASVDPARQNNEIARE